MADERRTGYLVLAHPWAGAQSRTLVEIVGETPRRFRIRAIERTRLAGRLRYIDAGQEALVPKHAVRDRCQRCRGERGGVPGRELAVGGTLRCEPCQADLLREQQAKADAVCVGCESPIGDPRNYATATRTLLNGGTLSGPSHRECLGRSAEALRETERASREAPGSVARRPRHSE